MVTQISTIQHKKRNMDFQTTKEKVRQRERENNSMEHDQDGFQNITKIRLI